MTLQVVCRCMNAVNLGLHHPACPYHPANLPRMESVCMAGHAEEITHLTQLLTMALWAIEWARECMNRGDGVLEFTGDLADAEKFLKIRSLIRAALPISPRPTPPGEDL